MEEVSQRLEQVMGGPVDGLERLSGGASRETWAFRSGGRDFVLRRDPPGRLKDFGSMAVEAAAIRACAEAGLAVPEIVAVDDDGDALGTPGIVMGRVPGEATGPRILRDPGLAAGRAVLTGQLASFLAALHRLDPGSVPGVTGADPLAYLTEMYDEADDTSPTFDLTLRWLHRNHPPAGGRVIVHGDFRLGNVIVGEDGLRAVLDWELVHLGDPLEDLAWLCVKAWRFGAAPEVAGVGTIDELLDAYQAGGGQPVDRTAFHWWLVQKTVQWGVICMKQASVHLTGASPSVELAAIGRRVAEQEWDLLELLAPAGSKPSVVGAGRAGGGGRPLGPPPDAGLYGRPTAEELLEAAEQFLRTSVTDATSGQVRFHARVAANVLAIVARQLRAGPGPGARATAGLEKLGAGSLTELSARIRAGDLDGCENELFPFLWETVGDRLAVANPRYLEG